MRATTQLLTTAQVGLLRSGCWPQVIKAHCAQNNWDPLDSLEDLGCQLLAGHEPDRRYQE